MKKFFSVLVENGIIASVALGISYLLSYYYQKGKLDYYGVSMTYVDFSLPSIVAIFAIALTICYSAILFMNPILYLAIGTRDYRMIKIWTMLIGLAIVFGTESVLMSSFPIISSAFLVLLLIYIFIEIILTIVKVKENCSFSQKWKKYSAHQLNRDKKESADTATGTFSGVNKKIQRVYLVVAMVFFLSLMFQFAGSHYAQSCTEYYIAKDYENKVVVHNTQEYYILMERDGEYLIRNYEIVPASEIGNICFEQTERLKVSNSKK